MNLGKILVTQYFCCKSYKEALEISKAYDSLSIKHFGLGRGQTISFKRSIRKYPAKTFSHMLKVYFWLKCGDFCDYGYVDPLSLKRYPELPQMLKNASDEEKFKIVCEYDHKSFDSYYGFTYYDDFEQYFKRKLQSMLNQIALAGTIAFAGRSHTNDFGIQYEERGQWFERGYSAYDAYTPYEDDEVWAFKGRQCLKMSAVWRWMEYAQRQYRWENQTIAIPITALSYVMNRMPTEQLIYSVIGLESIYVSKNQKHKQEQLKLLLPQVCSGITKDDVGKFYSLRSDFVHGNQAFPVYSRAPYYNFESKYTEPCSIKAAVALIMTIRALIEHNAFRIRNNGAGKIRFIQTDTI